MERPTVERARALLVTTVEDAGARALGRAARWWLVARARLEDLEPRLRQQVRQVRQVRQVPPPVQRFGKKLWERITARFPALSELLREPSAAARPARATTEDAVTHAAPGTAGAAARTGEHAGEHTADEPLDALLAALRDVSAEAAAAAALELGARPEPQAAAALREVLKNADGYFNPLTRVAALHALARALPSTPGLNELEPILELVRDLDAEVSMAAIDAIALRAPANVAIDRLLPVVLDDTGYFLPIVRMAASRALERAGLLTTATA